MGYIFQLYKKPIILAVLVLAILILILLIILNYKILINQFKISFTNNPEKSSTISTSAPLSIPRMPFFPNVSATVGELDEWQLNYIQPEVVDYQTDKDTNYLIVSYLDLNEEKREVRAFVSGQTPNGSYIDKVRVVYSNQTTEVLDFNQLRSKLFKGKQIKIEYLSYRGSTFDKVNCQNFDNFCALASIIENLNLKISSLESLLKEGKVSEVVIPVNVIYLEPNEE